jgi:S1-C subfamily serine protease
MSEPLCRDFIFPICECAPNEGGGGFRFVRFLGTGFLFGSAGFALTASHVLGSPTDQRLLMAMFVAPNQHWLGARILRRHIHPTEDVAVIQLEPVSGLPWYSPFGLSSTPAHSSCRYSLFGYPEDVANELVNESTSRVETRPDLVYSEGHVRRRATLALPSVRGSAFLELSQIAGQGCSGAPVFIPGWQVIGVYSSERLCSSQINMAYAVRTDSFRDWALSLISSASSV